MDIEMEPDEPIEIVSRSYFGKEVRLHLLLIGFLIVILTPLDRELLPFYATIGVVLILVSVILAGLTTRKNKIALIADVLISLLLFCTFEYMAIYAFRTLGTVWDISFILKQLIAILSVSSLYLSTRSLASRW